MPMPCFSVVMITFVASDLKEKAKRRDKMARNFTEGWIEFLSKRAAKEVANNLNNAQVRKVVLRCWTFFWSTSHICPILLKNVSKLFYKHHTAITELSNTKIFLTGRWQQEKQSSRCTLEHQVSSKVNKLKIILSPVLTPYQKVVASPKLFQNNEMSHLYYKEFVLRLKMFFVTIELILKVTSYCANFLKHRVYV